ELLCRFAKPSCLNLKFNILCPCSGGRHQKGRKSRNGQCNDFHDMGSVTKQYGNYNLLPPPLPKPLLRPLHVPPPTPQRRQQRSHVLDAALCILAALGHEVVWL